MKFAIAGAGSIVPTFLEAQVGIEEIEPYAICASERSRERMEGFSRQYGIRKIYYNYEEMIRDPEVEAVYIAVPNHLHYTFALQAMEERLHVICEKPFCTKTEELEKLIAMAEEKKLFLFEAISNLYFPNFRKVRELLPALGPIHIAELNYTQYSSRYPVFLRGEIQPVFDPEKCGGALMDLNVYNIHFVVGLFGKPEQVFYYPVFQQMPGMSRPVDTSGVLILTYPGMVCKLTAAKDCRAECRISLQGEAGCIMSSSPSNSFQEFTYHSADGSRTEYRLNEDSRRLYYELRRWTEMIEAGDYAFCRKQLEQSRIVQEILCEAMKSGKTQSL